MPLGYIRFKILYEDAGNPIDYQILDANYAAEAISNCRGAICRKKGQRTGWDVADTLPLLARTLASDHYIEQDKPAHDIRLIHSLHSLFQHGKTRLSVCCPTFPMCSKRTMRSIAAKNTLRNIYDNIPVGLELYDKTGRMVDINNKDMEIFGRPAKGRCHRTQFLR